MIEIATYPREYLGVIEQVAKSHKCIAIKVESRPSVIGGNTAKVDKVIVYKSEPHCRGGLDEFWTELLNKIYGVKL